ncbi:hypothetical protein [Thalassomonas haliotis]|uniref:Uncharacterized protein n=1 Tax=Thalassomonas haliotis TaxID=485448 RepID=A0ABY7VJR3_9GAMM|nr:hypothetical protein [Thalassomonas haliotis]WDE13831.1 hypothetical protein H3N35_10555 [Thalassomonas haliotis]
MIEMERYAFASFAELAREHNILYVEDDNAKTLSIDDIGNSELSLFVDYIKQYADKKGYRKLSVKIKEAQAIYFFQHGFRVEASILAYYGMQDAIFVVYYFNASDLPGDNVEQDKILDKVLAKDALPITGIEAGQVTVSRGCLTNQVEKKQQVLYSGREAARDSAKLESSQFIARAGNKDVAVATAQFNKADNAVEFSNFAVNIGYDASKYISYLLTEMESYYQSRGCLTAFTIVSANSLVINAICAENRYEFGGKLKNESVNDGVLVSLNTWFKRLLCPA